MRKTLEKLWNGTLEPAARSGIHNAERHNIEELINSNLEMLETGLPEDKMKVLNNYKQCVEEYLYLTGEQAFCDGFGLGTKTVMEALNCAEQII